jgi:nucleoside-diphosphate-sugar epimerase
MGQKIILPGGAGLVGQNLVVRLKAAGFTELVVIDKHSANVAVLREQHPDITVLEADVAQPGDWEAQFECAAAVVMLQAQIGGLNEGEFVANNQTSTERILELIRTYEIAQLVHISSSVVNSVTDDFYTRSKTAQEAMVVESGTPVTILRPTLMFGWFDRKHLGWLSRFMAKVPVFPIPGHGRYMRQPLYVGDFCDIIVSVLKAGGPTGIFDITGHERINYIDLMREVRRAARIKTPILKMPFGLFKALLAGWALFDKKPPFTTQQLEALVAKDEFDVIDWPDIFGVQSTPLSEAIEETFRHPVYSSIVLEF